MTQVDPGARRTGVLFVCLGNICRSPLAEGIFVNRARANGLAEQLVIDSAGTGHWHVGKPADPRSIAVGRRYGIEVPSIARQVDPDTDFQRFRYLIPMDESNKTTLIEWGAPRERVRLMRAFDPKCRNKPDHEIEVPDPYYGAGDGFETVFRMLDAACAGLLETLLDELRS